MTARTANPSGMALGPARGAGMQAALAAALLGALLALGAGLGGAQVVGLACLALLVGAIVIFPLVGVATLLVISQIYLVLTPYIPLGIPVAFLLLALTAVGVGLRRIVEPRRMPFRWHPLDVVAAAMLLNGLVYLPFSGSASVGLYGFHETFRHFILYMIVRWMAPDTRALRPVLIVLGVVAFGVLAYGCVQHFVGYEDVMLRYNLTEDLRGYAGFNKAGVRRIYSIMGSPLQLALLAMMSSLFALAILGRPGRRDAAWVFAQPLFLVGLAAALFSYTRSSWLGIAAGLGVAVLLVARGKGRLALLGLPLLVGLALFRWAPEVLEKIGSYALTIVSTDPVDTSFHYLALYEAARFFWSHKLGAGLGSASFSGLTHGEGIQIWSENTYLLLGVQVGFQALLGLVAFVILSAGTGLRLLRNAQAGLFERRLGAAVLFGFAGFAVAGMSLPVLLDVSAVGPLWLVTALAVTAGEDLRRTP